jgi:hypothetical protein
MANDSPAAAPFDRRLIEETILALAGGCGLGKTICPMEAAKAIAAAAGQEAAWHTCLGAVRRTAVMLAKQGRLVIYRKGKPVDPDDFRGVYRLGLPRSE